MSTAEAVRHALIARRHAALALDAVLPGPLRERRAELRRESRAILRVIVAEALRERPGEPAHPTETTRPSRVTID